MSKILVALNLNFRDEGEVLELGGVHEVTIVRDPNWATLGIKNGNRYDVVITCHHGDGALSLIRTAQGVGVPAERILVVDTGSLAEEQSAQIILDAQGIDLGDCLTTPADAMQEAVAFFQ